MGRYICAAAGIYLLLINIAAYAVYFGDKQRAVKHRRRIPEHTLILLAAVGGSAGAAIAMRVFHHKTKKPKFYIGVPIILILQIAVLIAAAYVTIIKAFA